MEIETKAIISKEQFADLICKYSSRLEYLDKKDTYYSKYDTYEKRKENHEPTLRIREESGKHFFTIKKKSVVDGVEKNEESETGVEDINVVKEALEASGLKPYFVKTKKSWGLKEVLIDDNPAISFNGGVRPLSFNIYDAISEYKTFGHIEIECINDSIYAVELEVIFNPEEKSYANFEIPVSALVTQRVPTKEDRIREAILKWFEDNGLKEQIDNRSWMTILGV